VIRERRECDVYGTTKDVKSITVKVMIEGYEGDESPDEVIPFKSLDLSRRARKRLLKFIERGLSKPGT